MWLCLSYCLVGASPLPFVVGYIFLVGSNILLSVIVQYLQFWCSCSRRCVHDLLLHHLGIEGSQLQAFTFLGNECLELFSSCKTETLYLLASNFKFPLPSSSGNHHSTFCLYGFALNTSVTQYLSFCGWFISLSIMFSSFICVVAWVFFCCMHTPHFVYPFISWWTFELLLFFN